MSKVTMWRSRWRCVIKPAYSVSFLLSINIFVWQNILYFPNDLRNYCFPLQQWLREHASMFHYKYTACVVLNCSSGCDNLFACLCSGPLPVFHCSITAQKNRLLPQPYSSKRFGSVKFSVRAEALCRAMSILNVVMVCIVCSVSVKKCRC